MTSHIVIPGYNCEAYAHTAIQSVLAQQGVSRHLWLLDDGSADRTRPAVFHYATMPEVTVLWHHDNRGAAASRWALLQEIRRLADPEDVVVLLDMDDRLAHSGVVARVADEYRNGAEATYGCYRMMDGGEWPQEPYPEEVIRRRSYRVAPWHCWPLRTFKIKYTEALTEQMFKDDEGQWLRACTDVALMFPILEQLPPNGLHFIDEVLYLYRGYHPNVTRKRWGKPYKNEMNRLIRSREALGVLV